MEEVAEVPLYRPPERSPLDCCTALLAAEAVQRSPTIAVADLLVERAAEVVPWVDLSQSMAVVPEVVQR